MFEDTIAAWKQKLEPAWGFVTINACSGCMLLWDKQHRWAVRLKLRVINIPESATVSLFGMQLQEWDKQWLFPCIITQFWSFPFSSYTLRKVSSQSLNSKRFVVVFESKFSFLQSRLIGSSWVTFCLVWRCSHLFLHIWPFRWSFIWLISGEK